LTLSCGIPGGIFTPTVAMGAVVGQLYISIIMKILSFFQLTDVIQFRGVYTILGAAAFAGSVTRTISVSMIILELNGHLSHAVPTMVCVLTSYAISEWIKPESFFEMLSHIGGLDAKLAAKGKIIIKDLLETNPEYKELQFLSLNDCSEADLIEIV
jgi:H+/Cl- antiporter ClcA